MNNSDLTISFLVDQTPEESFNAVNNVKGWWTENMKGDSLQQGDEFEVRFGDVHYSRHKLTEVIPGKKVVWLTTDSRLNFVEDKNEWTGTSIIFDISKQGSQTEVRFTHQGLMPGVACYDACSNAWGSYISGSLQGLITTGKGQPSLKEGE